jgi:hypothetical protein
VAIRPDLAPGQGEVPSNQADPDPAQVLITSIILTTEIVHATFLLDFAGNAGRRI